MSLLFNTLSSLVITFLPSSKRLLISWLQSPSAVIFGAKKIKSDTVSTVSHPFTMKWWDQMPWSSFSECWALSQLFHSPLSLSSRSSLVPLYFLWLGWYHLLIWDCGYFSYHSWFQVIIHSAQHFPLCALHISQIKRVSIYSLGEFLSQFGTSPLFHIWF